jgi:NADH-quinone oxidoreductase subunit E
MPAPAKNLTPFHYWISLFPQAPLFGVEWQFAKFFKAESTVAPMNKKAPTASSEKKVAKPTVSMKPVMEEVATHAAAVETVDAETPAVAPPAKLYDIAPVDADDLKALKGVGPKLETMLNEMGIYRFEQIASFNEANLAWVDANLTSFKGRPFREDWVSQAKELL